MKCINCGKQTDSIRSVISKGKIINGCNNCLSNNYQQGNSASYYRKAQQQKFERELTQPVAPREFSRAYPKEARKMYGDEKFRKYST